MLTTIEKVFKLLSMLADGITALQKMLADYHMKKANEKAAKGDQREFEKQVDGVEPGPTQLTYTGLFEREKKPKAGS